LTSLKNSNVMISQP